MVTHPIPGNGYVPPSKIFLAFGGALAVVSAVFAYQAKKAYVPPTLNRVGLRPRRLDGGVPYLLALHFCRRWALTAIKSLPLLVSLALATCNK